MKYSFSEEFLKRDSTIVLNYLMLANYSADNILIPVITEKTAQFLLIKLIKSWMRQVGKVALWAIQDREVWEEATLKILAYMGK